MLVRLLPLLLLLTLAVAAYLLLRRRGSGVGPVAAAPRLVSDAAARHHDAVAAARELLQHAEAAHARAVARAQDHLTEAGLDVPVMTLGGLRLGRLSLLVDGRERRLTPGTRFSADVEGQVRWVPVEDEGGRLRVEAEDLRSVHVAVTDTGWSEQVELPGDQADEAGRFAVAGAAVVRSLDQARSARGRRITAALEELAAVRADTEELDRARLTLEDLEGAGPLRGDLPTAPPDGPDDGRDPS